MMTCPECGRGSVRTTRIQGPDGMIEVLAGHMEARVGPLGPYLSLHKCKTGSHMPLSEVHERNLNAAQEEAAAAARRRGRGA